MYVRVRVRACVCVCVMFYMSECVCVNAYCAHVYKTVCAWACVGCHVCVGIFDNHNPECTFAVWDCARGELCRTIINRWYGNNLSSVNLFPSPLKGREHWEGKEVADYWEVVGKRLLTERVYIK